MQTELDSADLSVCSTGAWFDPGCSVYVIMNRKMFWCCLSSFVVFSPLLPLFFLLGLPLPPHHKLVYTCPLLATQLAKPPRKTQTKTPTKPPTKTQTKTMVKTLPKMLSPAIFGRLVYSCPRLATRQTKPPTKTQTKPPTKTPTKKHCQNPSENAFSGDFWKARV